MRLRLPAMTPRRFQLTASALLGLCYCTLVYIVTPAWLDKTLLWLWAVILYNTGKIDSHYPKEK